jgi:hypothetical protein
VSVRQRGASASTVCGARSAREAPCRSHRRLPNSRNERALRRRLDFVDPRPERRTPSTGFDSTPPCFRRSPAITPPVLLHPNLLEPPNSAPAPVTRSADAPPDPPREGEPQSAQTHRLHRPLRAACALGRGEHRRPRRARKRIPRGGPVDPTAPPAHSRNERCVGGSTSSTRDLSESTASPRFDSTPSGFRRSRAHHTPRAAPPQPSRPPNPTPRPRRALRGRSTRGPLVRRRPSRARRHGAQVGLRGDAREPRRHCLRSLSVADRVPTPAQGTQNCGSSPHNGAAHRRTPRVVAGSRTRSQRPERLPTLRPVAGLPPPPRTEAARTSMQYAASPTG